MLITEINASMEHNNITQTQYLYFFNATDK